MYLHRVLLEDDLIELFSDPTMVNVKLEVTLIGNNGNNEDGKGDGVLREILTSFWQLVPCIRHELQKTQWEAIARIIVFGVKSCNYFPIFLSCAVSCWNHIYFMYQQRKGTLFKLHSGVTLTLMMRTFWISILGVIRK